MKTYSETCQAPEVKRLVSQTSEKCLEAIQPRGLNNTANFSYGHPRLMISYSTNILFLLLHHSALQQVSAFLRILCFPQPIKLTIMT